jgi:hypothetical protein
MISASSKLTCKWDDSAIRSDATSLTSTIVVTYKHSSGSDRLNITILFIIFMDRRIDAVYNNETSCCAFLKLLEIRIFLPHFPYLRV